MFGPSFLVLSGARVVMNLFGVKPKSQLTCLAVLAGLTLPIDPIGATANIVRSVTKMNAADDLSADATTDGASDLSAETAADGGGGVLDAIGDLLS